MSNLLHMQGIYKSFGGVNALTDAHLDVERGEIHALRFSAGGGPGFPEAIFMSFGGSR